MMESLAVDERPDDALLEASRQGDLAAWEVLLQRHVPALGAYIGARLRRAEVVDRLLVKAVVEAWKHLAQCGDPTEFPRWLRKIGATVALRWHKEHPHEELCEVLPAQRCAHSRLDVAQLQRLDALLGQLPADQRMIVEQRFRGGVQGSALWQAVHLDAQRGPALLLKALNNLERTWKDGGV